MSHAVKCLAVVVDSQKPFARDLFLVGGNTIADSQNPFQQPVPQATVAFHGQGCVWLNEPRSGYVAAFLQL